MGGVALMALTPFLAWYTEGVHPAAEGNRQIAASLFLRKLGMAETGFTAEAQKS